MARWSHLFALALLAAGHAVEAHAHAPASSSHEPSEDAARENAFHIFNAVHSAMRQWGSSIKHNGLSFFLAKVPEGNLFYHGTRQRNATQRPKSFEWLAFEIEHATQFGLSFSGGSQTPPRVDPPKDDEQARMSNDAAAGLLSGREELLRLRQLSRLPPSQAAASRGESLADEDDDDDKKKPPPGLFPPEFFKGYVHTYRAARDLNLLYIDGQAAANSVFGPLDLEDFVFLDWPVHQPPYRLIFAEWERAGALCDRAREWAWEGGRIDGFVRMEAGFEIIYCDFQPGGGLDLVSVNGSPFLNESAQPDPMAEIQTLRFEWSRAVGTRYQGFPTGRIHIDYSSMVSAFAYPLNISNYDASRPDLPRIANTTREERQNVQARLREVVEARHGWTPRSGEGVDWQGVVDMIVDRYSDKLALLAFTDVPFARALAEVNYVANHYISYPTDDPYGAAHLDRCATHFLEPALLRPERYTPEDRAVHAAIEEVTRAICNGFFEARRVLHNETADSNGGADPVRAAQAVFADLVGRLSWTTWRECQRCPRPDQFCLVAMFPFGDTNDHFHPHCKDIDEFPIENSYWLSGWDGHFPFPPGKGDDKNKTRPGHDDDDKKDSAEWSDDL